MRIANRFLLQHAQIFKLLFMPSATHQALFMFSLCCVALIPVAIFLGAYGFNLLLVCAIFSWTFFGFLVFHGQICAVASNRQLRLLPDLKPKILQQFFIAVLVIAGLLWASEWLLEGRSPMGFEGALALSFLANTLLLLLARFWPIMLPLGWFYLVLEFGLLRTMVVEHTALLLGLAGVCVPVLVLSWNKLLPNHSYKNPQMALVDGASYWRLFYQRHFAFFNLLHWSARSLQGSVLAGRADNPWRRFWAWLLFALVVVALGIVIKQEGGKWHQQVLQINIIPIMFAGYMLNISRRLAEQLYANLGRLWLYFSGDRAALLRHLELRSARLLWLNAFAGSAVALVVLLLLNPALLTTVDFWWHASSMLVCLWLLQAILFYVSLVIYGRTEADKVWLSTVVSMAVVVLIFVVGLLAILVDKQLMNLNLLWLLAQCSLALVAWYWRMRVYRDWHRFSLVKRGSHV